MLNLGLDELGIYPPETGHTNEDGCVVGSLGGTVNIGAMGGLNYTIPIEVPVGINGMQPSISIGYSNQAGNGLLGWGWDLIATSCITRTGQTLYHDGKMTAADLSKKDRFVLDGQRLILVKGLYGYDGSEYKTENDCMSKIKLYSSSDGEYFKVWERSGNILEYRERLCTPNSPNLRRDIMWLLNKVTDRYGNAMEYYYTTNHNTGEIVLDYIEYTYNEGQEVKPQFQVKFDYTSDRQDYEFYYIGGCQLQHKNLLESISVFQISTKKKVFHYKFDYTKSLTGNNNDPLYHTLSSIVKEAYAMDDSFEKVETVINWDQTSPLTTEKHRVDNFDIKTNFPFMGDFNGDGYTDIAAVPYKNNGEDNYENNVKISIYLNDRNGGFTRASTMDIDAEKTLDWIYILDINGDGLDDIVPYFYDTIPSDEVEITTLLVYQNKRECFEQIGEHRVKSKSFVVTGDFDGNGTADVVLLEKEFHKITHWFWELFNIFDTEMVPYIENIYWMGVQDSGFECKKLNERSLGKKLGPTYDIVSFDYNGDNLNEVLLVGLKNDYYNHYGTKLGKFDFSDDSDDGITIIETYTENEYPYYENGYPDRGSPKWCYIFPGDFNGDGKTDLLYYYKRWRIIFSEGDVLGEPNTISTGYLDDYIYGLPELGTQYFNLYFPSLAQASNTSDSQKTMFAVADFDGDGCSDVCYSRELDYTSLNMASRINKDGRFRRKKSLGNFYSRSQFTHVGNFMGRDNMSLLALQGSDKTYIVSPISISRYNSVASITDGMGNTTSFTYDYLMPKNGNHDTDFYTFNFQYSDRYGVRHIPLPVMALRTCQVHGINNSSFISKYSYSDAKYHKNGHGFIGFSSVTTETYRNSTETPWKTKKAKLYKHETMGSHAMMLPSCEYNYINRDGQAKLVSETYYDFDKVILSNNSTNLVTCPALTWQMENTYNMDDGDDLIKKVVTEYEYDYNRDKTYNNAYGCLTTAQTVTGYENWIGRIELEMQRSTNQSTFANTWIVNRPDNETVVITRNGESVATHTEYEYLSDDKYQPNQVTHSPNDGNMPIDRFTTVTTYGYDDFGNLTDVTTEAPHGIQGEEPRTVHYRFGNEYQHRLLTKEIQGEESEGYITKYDYDFHDRPKAITDCNEHTIVHESSPLGVIRKTFSIDETEQRTVTLWATNSPYKPENATYYTWSKKTGGVTAMTFYHKSGLELRSVTFDFNGTPVFADKKYNEDGLLEKESAPYRQGEPEQWTSYAYDDHERLTSITYPDGTVKSMDYHDLKTITTVTDCENNSQKTVAMLNAMGWLKESTDSEGTQHPTTVHYEYYPDGQLKWTRINDDETTKIRLEYDRAGNRTLLHDPDYCLEKQDLISVYNAYGEEVSTTTPRNLTTTYQYDHFGRMTHRIESEPSENGGVESKTTVWNYNEDPETRQLGLLDCITYPGQTVHYKYDHVQRLSDEITVFSQSETYTTHYSYDRASRKEGVVFPSGYAVKYHYNSIGHFESITDSYGHELYRTAKTTAMGQTERFVMGGDMVSERDYHPEKHALTRIHTAKGENILQDLWYDYDGFGNLAVRKDNMRDLEESFAYDHLNRLTGIMLNGSPTGDMGYDPYGRMKGKVSDNALVFSAAVYDRTSKPHAIDAAKTCSGVFPAERQRITYTCFDKVKTIKEGGKTLEYAYGHDRQRIGMTEQANGVVRTKRYVGACEFVTRTDADGTSKVTYTFLTGPTGVFAVVETLGDGKHYPHYVLKDHLGSWTTITDADGTVEREQSFDAWGNLRDPETWTGTATEGPMFDRGFTGHEHIVAFGLINMNGRCYDPVTSSFLSVDAYVQSPDNSQSFNRYAYCQNNPLRYTDPTGWQQIGGTTPRPQGFYTFWGDYYSRPAYEPRDFGLKQLSDVNPDIAWMEANEMHGGSRGDVKPAGKAEVEVIRNTLPQDARAYVRLDHNGLIDKDLLNSYMGESLNVSNLKALVNSDIMVEIVLDDGFAFKGEDGNIGHVSMSYFPFDPLFPEDKDVLGETISGLSTGESGHIGQTLFPGLDGDRNSLNDNIMVIINKHLSPAGAAEAYSHEANGHALLYIINGGDRFNAGHIFQGSMDVNVPLRTMIINSKKETIYNMRRW